MLSAHVYLDVESSETFLPQADCIRLLEIIKVYCLPALFISYLAVLFGSQKSRRERPAATLATS